MTTEVHVGSGAAVVGQRIGAALEAERAHHDVRRRSGVAGANHDQHIVGLAVDRGADRPDVTRAEDRLRQHQPDAPAAGTGEAHGEREELAGGIGVGPAAEAARRDHGWCVRRAATGRAGCRRRRRSRQSPQSWARASALNDAGLDAGRARWRGRRSRARGRHGAADRCRRRAGRAVRRPRRRRAAATTRKRPSPQAGSTIVTTAPRHHRRAARRRRRLRPAPTAWRTRRGPCAVARSSVPPGPALRRPPVQRRVGRCTRPPAASSRSAVTNGRRCGPPPRSRSARTTWRSCAASTTRSISTRSPRSTCRCHGCSTSTSTRPRTSPGCRRPSSARSRRGCPTSSASPAASPWARARSPASCRRCSPAGPTTPTSAWSPPTASCTRTRSSRRAG